MLKISDEFLEKIMSCSWLSRCGEYEDIPLDFEVGFMKNKKEAVRSINSIAWENICLDAAGDLDVFLVKNRLDRKYDWNTVCDEIEEKYIKPISEKIKESIEHHLLPERVMIDVRFNLWKIFKYQWYSGTGFVSDFHTKMTSIYLAGYLPCGYKIVEEKGIFMIY